MLEKMKVDASRPLEKRENVSDTNEVHDQGPLPASTKSNRGDDEQSLAPVRSSDIQFPHILHNQVIVISAALRVPKS